MGERAHARPASETSGSSQRPARRVAGPLLTFDPATELASLKAEASWQRGDRNARTLVEERGFRLVLTALKTGALMREHRAAGWVSVQCLAGRLRLQARASASELPAGHVLVLPPDVPHSVEALEESGFLLASASGDQPGEGG